MFKSTKPRQRLGALLIAGAAAGSAVGLAAATASPALADDDGNTFCFLSTGKLSAAVTGSSSPHPIEIQWSSNVPACGQYSLLISGPGFNENANENGSGLQFTYLPPGAQGTWTLTLLQNDGTGTRYTLATTSITGPS